MILEFLLLVSSLNFLQSSSDKIRLSLNRRETNFILKALNLSIESNRNEYRGDYRDGKVLSKSNRFRGGRGIIDKISNMPMNKIHLEVKLKYFSSNYDYTGLLKNSTPQGEDIPCVINEEGKVEQFTLPPNFPLSCPIKLFAHGFNAQTLNWGEAHGVLWFVKAWMKVYHKKVNVIMLDWSSIAKGGIMDYKDRSHKAIDVGIYVGRCLAKLSEVTGFKASDIHLLGHSLGAHLVGKAGRVYKALTGQPLARITGLDPAGPLWVAGGCLLDLLNPLLGDAPLLRENKLSRESAAFVDVLHTDGDYQPCGTIMRGKGYLGPLGHSDFYASHGGRHQHGCGMLSYFWPHEKIIHGETCNHYRAVLYYLHRYG